jgi:hypothetical protein
MKGRILTLDITRRAYSDADLLSWFEARVNRRSHWLTRIANRSRAKPGLVNAPTQRDSISDSDQ